MLSKLFKNFQKKEKLPLDYFYTTDLHSHLIPNIDDGVKTLEESVEIIKNLKNLGYKKLITTPHIMSHRFPNNKETKKHLESKKLTDLLIDYISWKTRLVTPRKRKIIINDEVNLSDEKVASVLESEQYMSLKNKIDEGKCLMFG